ncbi:rhodanese-like domain-containing protein [Niabella hirudinis]|uniref:rhodanese-like domain-containing protein n=1 Tax=Niabella hirudinis TaxID=1285929 RepID=UPI003EBF2932
MNTITVQELKKRIDGGEKINLVDVREPAEYDEYNIGGQLIPLGKIQNMEVEELEPLKEDEVIIHCRSGKRSAAACLMLDAMGFKNTVNVEGGILAWQDAFGQ